MSPEKGGSKKRTGPGWKKNGKAGTGRGWKKRGKAGGKKKKATKKASKKK